MRVSASILKYRNEEKILYPQYRLVSMRVSAGILKYERIKDKKRERSLVSMRVSASILKYKIDKNSEIYFNSFNAR